MWIFMPSGFLSVVKHRTKPDSLLVRGRDRESVEAFAREVGVSVSATEGDYRYRVVVSRSVFRAYMDRMVDRIDYDNFKNAAHGEGTWNQFLYTVWGAGLRYQDMNEEMYLDG